MSTRACYTFNDGSEEYSVYKHHDGYPSGAAKFIKNAAKSAWPFPRFEADEFAASFVAANKGCAGGVRLIHHWDDVGDIEYHYQIFSNGEFEPQVIAYAIDSNVKDGWSEIWKGPFKDLDKLAICEDEKEENDN